MAQSPWLSDLSFYENKNIAALEFKSRVMLKRAIKAIWNESDFVGMPVEMASGNTFFVPKAAVRMLRDRKLTFIEHPVIDPNRQ